LYRTILFALGAVCALALAVAGVAGAKKPPSNSATGTGTVFAPNPVQELGDQSLTDQKDADYAALQAAYHDVTLTNLDGSGFLRGDWATIVSETGNPAYSTSNTFRYRRNDDRFEQVVAYYWITEAQKYIQSLGFGTWLRPVNMEPQRLRINQFGVDNSFATTHKDEIRLGKGGVDDAEDAEVVLHEYGHAIHFSQDFAFASTEADAISEGFGDYWAVTVSERVRQSLGLPLNAPAACVADWDSTSYTSEVPHCLRRVDTDLHYPKDLDGRVHHDGMIWSRALWDIRTALGSATADTIVLEGQFGFAGTTMPQLAQATVTAANQLFGAAAAATVHQQFQARGIL
jgi:zinc metalloprotease ZmpB